MGQGHEQHPVGSRERGAERQHGVGGGAGQQRPGLVGPETAGPAGWPARARAAPSGPWPAGGGAGPQRGQHGGQDLVDVPGQGGEQAAVGPGVAAQARRRLVHRAHGWRRRGPRRGGGRKPRAGVSSLTPRAARSTLRKNGDASTRGWTAEHTSWRNPGRVSSSVRHPPPGTGPFEDLDGQAGRARSAPPPARWARSRPRRRRRELTASHGSGAPGLTGTGAGRLGGGAQHPRREACLHGAGAGPGRPR